MPGIYGILNTGKGALLTEQKAIDVTGHNVANVNTPGYSRQRVNTETNEPISISPGQVGTGVRATEIQRIYDRFLGVQINNENQYWGRWEAQKGALERAEVIFDESTGYGLNQAMSEFWNAWQDLSDNPSGKPQRVVLVAKTEALTSAFNKMALDLKRIQQDTDRSIKGTINEINMIAKEIADLNRVISQEEGVGQNANDFRDKRDLLLKQLSLLIDISTLEDNEGKVAVLVGGGRPLVEGVFNWNLSAGNTSGFNKIMHVDSDGNSVDITHNIAGGKMKGWLEARDVAVPKYLNKINDLSVAMMNEINSIHQKGYGLTTDPSGNPYTNIDFFSGTSASDMAVNLDIINDVKKIAAAGSAGGVPGDNSNAISIANLQNELKMDEGTETFDSYFNSLVSEIGVEVGSATVKLDHQTAVIDHLNNSRESISGVSLDEEMVNLIKFQHAYDAAAQLINKTDELLDTVINMV